MFPLYQNGFAPDKRVNVQLTQRQIDALYMAAVVGLAMAHPDALDRYAVRQALALLSAAPHPLPTQGTQSWATLILNAVLKI